MNTADRIVDTAEALIQQKGYHGFSFQEIAEEIGIKKASIYYHFPAKAELGRAVINRYRGRMMKAAATLDAEGKSDHWQVLSMYLEPIAKIGRVPNEACLCAVLGGEYLSLPEDMQTETKAFFAEHQVWLTQLLTEGRAAGAFSFNGEPAALARLLFSAIEGSMLIKRTTQETGYVDEIVQVAAMILGRPSKAD